MAVSPPLCRHCGAPLKKWLVPDGASWVEEFFWVCFNDACTYYVEGWDWMLQQYGQHTSYRYAVNPATGAPLMIPVWSNTATRELIADDVEDVSHE